MARVVVVVALKRDRVPWAPTAALTLSQGSGKTTNSRQSRRTTERDSETSAAEETRLDLSQSCPVHHTEAAVSLPHALSSLSTALPAAEQQRERLVAKQRHDLLSRLPSSHRHTQTKLPHPFRTTELDSGSVEDGEDAVCVQDGTRYEAHNRIAQLQLIQQSRGLRLRVCDRAAASTANK